MEPTTWSHRSYRNRVPSFLMISSDKAVRPADVMGLTKTRGGTRCVAIAECAAAPEHVCFVSGSEML